MDKEHFITRITRFSLTRRITVFVIFLTVVAVGLIATNRLPLEMNPRGMEGHYIEVGAHWNVGVPPETLDKIGMPLEEELSTVRGLKHITTDGYKWGARVRLEFKYGTDMDVAYREVRDRVERARTRFPQGTQKPYIRQHKPGSEPVVGFRVSFDPESDYYDRINKYIVTPIQRISGVADVEFWIRQREVRIEVDKDRAEAAGTNIRQLGGMMRSDNFTLASGTVEDGGKKYILKSTSEFKTIDQIRHIPLKPNIFLDDIATVSYVPEEAERLYRFKGQPASAVMVKREGEANTVETSQMVVEAVEEMQRDSRLEGFDLSIFNNQGKEIVERLNNLISNGRLGALLAALVLYFFLRHFRLTIIIALAIPLCLLIALTALYFAGETLNGVTIMGLVICIGLLVDNSVVVAENIHRHHQDGLSRREACLRGVTEIGFAITIATLTTLIVFGSALLAEGEMEFYVSKITLPIIASITASLGTALMFIPLCVYLTLPKHVARKRRSPSAAVGRLFELVYGLVFERINQGYHTALRFFLQRRLDLSVILIVMLAGTFSMGGTLNFRDKQDEKMRDFGFNIRFPDHYSMDQRLAFMRRVEKLVEENADDYGLKYYESHYGKWFGHFRGAFAHDRVHPLTREEAVDKLFEDFPEEPGVRVQYRGKEGQEQKDDHRHMHHIRLVGDDPELLKQVAKDLKPSFEMIPGVVSFLDKDSDEAPSEMSLIVDRDRASSLGVNLSVLAGTIQSAVSGDQLPRFNNKGRQVPVRLRFQDEDRSELADLSNYLIPAEDGRVSTVGELTTVAFQRNEDDGISRRDKKISEWFGMKLEPSPDSWKVKRNIEALKKQINLPEGVSFDESRVKFGDDEHKQGGMMITLAIVFVYMLMAFFFESTLIPLSIILTIPLASIGAILALKITDTFIDQMAYMGGMLLVGIVVNNGIVLIDYTNRLRREGIERAEALAKATQHRFRPIVMTALTTICGMIPLTFGDSEGMGASFKAFGLVLIGGMTSATLFTLVVVPVFYSLIEDAQASVNNILASVFNRIENRS